MNKQIGEDAINGNERILTLKELNDVLKTAPGGGYALNPFLLAQDAKSIAARDKWWLGLLQAVNDANDLKDLQERFAHLLRYVADLGIKREVGQ